MSFETRGCPAHLVFDLDGTLIDSAEGILTALRCILEARGLRAHVPIDQSLIGPPLQQVLQLVTGTRDKTLLDELASQFRDVYDQETFANSVPYPGVDDMLLRLSARGASLYVATNKRAVPTQKILHLVGWHNRFQSVYCADTVRGSAVGKVSMLAELVRTEIVDPSRAMFVGDSTDDAEAALSVGMRFVGVTWGYGSELLFERFPNVVRVSSAAQVQ